ncbi:SDR family NAD(P)-dependent oxidoreductase [Thermodesulfobacteriota bacterium]
MGNLLNGKVAVITGAGRGIGRAHAIAMVEQGAKVVVNDPGVALDGTGGDKSLADEVVAEIKEKGCEAAANYDSIATPEGAASLIKTAIDNFGRLDILVNNAGVSRDGMIWELSDEDIDEVLKVHLYGHFYCAREAMKIFHEQKSGRIINTSSGAGKGGKQGYTNYAAAKEGIVGLTRALAGDARVCGNVTANCIRPLANTTRLAAIRQEWVASATEKGNFIVTPLSSALASMPKVPPEGVSPLVVFLASDAADNINGCIFDTRKGYVGIYRDPPYIEGTIWKDGNWTPEELAEIMPKSLSMGKVR